MSSGELAAVAVATAVEPPLTLVAALAGAVEIRAVSVTIEEPSARTDFRRD
jgi:hypothetical protein